MVRKAPARFDARAALFERAEELLRPPDAAERQNRYSAQARSDSGIRIEPRAQDGLPAPPRAPRERTAGTAPAAARTGAHARPRRRGGGPQRAGGEDETIAEPRLSIYHCD